MKPLKGFLFNILLLSFSLFIAFIIAEIAIRSFDLSKTWASYIASKNILKNLEYDANVGFKRTPNTNFIGPRDVAYKINALGFRDSGALAKPKKKKKRVCYLGDSVTEGFGVEENDRFSNIVNGIVQQDTLEYDFLNLAVAGYSTYNEYLVFKTYALDFKPDIAILQVCFNDIIDNKIFDIKLASTGIEHVFAYQEQVKTSIGKSFFQKNSALYLFLAEKYNYLRLKSGKTTTILEYTLNISSKDLLKTQEAFNDLNTICVKNNIKLLVIYIPTEAEVATKNEENSQYISTLIENSCKQLNINFISTVLPLRKEEKDFYLDDCHLNKAGHRLIGNIISSHLHSSS